MSNDIKIRITPLALDKLNAPPPAPAQPAEPQSLLDRLFNSPREPPKPFPVPIVQDPVKDVPIWRRFFKSDTSDTESQHSRALTSNTKPILGIRYRPTTMEDGTPCVLITSVVQDSICDRAGVKEQDVVMSWNGYPIENEEQLIKYYQASKYGETVTLTCRPFNHINDATKERQYNIHLSLGSAFSDCSSVVDSTFTSEIVATDTDNSTPNYSIVSESVNSTAVSDQNHGELLHHFTKIPDSPRTPALTSKKSETGSAFSRISTLVSSTKSAPSSPRGQPVVAKQPPIKIGFFGIKSNPPAPSSPVLVPQPTDTQLKPKLGINFIEKPHPKPSLNHEVAVVVVSVFEGSICYEAGLQVDDMFISWNEKPIYTSDDLNEAYSSAKLGDTVVLRMRPYSLAQHCHMDKICIITIAHGVDQGRMRDALAARGEKLVYLNDCISEKRLALKDALSNVKAQAILPSVKMKGDLVHREEAETHKMNAVDIESELLNLEYERYSLEQLQAKEKSLRAHQQIAELEYLRRTNLSLKSRLKNLELFVKHKMEENQILRSLLQHKSTSTSQELNTENDSDFDSDEDNQDQTSTAAPPKS